MQVTNGTYLIATDRVTNISTIAMEGTMQLTLKILAEKNIDFNELQSFFNKDY